MDLTVELGQLLYDCPAEVKCSVESKLKLGLVTFLKMPATSVNVERIELIVREVLYDLGIEDSCQSVYPTYKRRTRLTRLGMI